MEGMAFTHEFIWVCKIYSKVESKKYGKEKQYDQVQTRTSEGYIVTPNSAWGDSVIWYKKMLPRQELQD